MFNIHTNEKVSSTYSQFGKLLILIKFVWNIQLCGCNRGGEGGNGCGRKNGGRHGGCGGLSGHSSSSNDYRDYDYDIIPLPDEVGTVKNAHFSMF